MALYPTCQTSIHNIEFNHGCFTILIVYQSILRSFISYATVLVRIDDPGTDRGSLCFRACSSVLLVHPNGMRDPLDMTVLHGMTGVDDRW